MKFKSLWLVGTLFVFFVGLSFNAELVTKQNRIKNRTVVNGTNTQSTILTDVITNAASTAERAEDAAAKPSEEQEIEIAMKLSPAILWKAYQKKNSELYDTTIKKRFLFANTDKEQEEWQKEFNDAINPVAEKSLNWFAEQEITLPDGKTEKLHFYLNFYSSIDTTKENPPQQYCFFMLVLLPDALPHEDGAVWNTASSCGAITGKKDSIFYANVDILRGTLTKHFQTIAVPLPESTAASLEFLLLNKTWLNQGNIDWQTISQDEFNKKPKSFR